MRDCLACHQVLSREVARCQYTLIPRERSAKPSRCWRGDTLPIVKSKRRIRGLYCHEEHYAAGDRHRLMAQAAMVRRQHVGQAARHVHARHPVSREVSGRPGGCDQRRGAGRARYPDARRLSLRRRLRRPQLAPLPAPALDRLRRRSSPVGGNAQRVAAVSARDAPQRDLHGLALAARHRQDRASPARLRQDLASRAEQDTEASPLRHLLLAGDGSLSRHPHRQVQGQPRGCLGHGGRDEHGAARASGRRLPLHPDRGTNAALHGQHLRRKAREGQVHGRVLQPRGPGARRCGDLDPHLLGQSQHAARDGGHELQGVVRVVSERTQGRRVDDRNQGSSVPGHRTVRSRQGQAAEEDLHRRSQPPHASGRPRLRGRRFHPHRARIHRPRTADRVERLRVRASGLQPGDRVS